MRVPPSGGNSAKALPPWRCASVSETRALSGGRRPSWRLREETERLLTLLAGERAERVDAVGAAGAVGGAAFRGGAKRCAAGWDQARARDTCGDAMVDAAERETSGASSVAALLHRARSPLTAVVGFAESLAARATAGTLTTERLVDRLGRIRVAAQRIEALLDELGEAMDGRREPPVGSSGAGP